LKTVENAIKLAPVEFRFNTKLDQTILLGKKARNIQELYSGIRTTPDASIYFHTHKFLQQHHYLSPEPPNDFAYWVTNILNEDALGERLSSIDIIQFDKISSLRKRFIDIIGVYLDSSHRLVDAPVGQEFYFMSAQTFIFATPYEAHDLTEFKEILRKVSIHSLYYHFFDAALRLEQGENDFSVWFRRIGEPSLANEVLRLDPYTYTLEGLRQKLIRLVAQYDQH
jgi:uncharacterized protein DUF5752